MKYREPRNISIEGMDRSRYILVPVPYTAGQWFLCTPHVEAPCPRCGAKPYEPCTSTRGHVALSMIQAQTALELARDGKTYPSNARRLVTKIKNARYYRAGVHEGRKLKWQELGMRRSTRQKGSTAHDCARALEHQIAELQGLLAKIRDL